VQDFCKDENREADMGNVINQIYTISGEEIEALINDLPKGKPCCNDNFAEELLQSMEKERVVEIMIMFIGL
jgi:uncharacterized tellurite resistance protein B-like protein